MLNVTTPGKTVQWSVSMFVFLSCYLSHEAEDECEGGETPDQGAEVRDIPVDEGQPQLELPDARVDHEARVEPHLVLVVGIEPSYEQILEF